MSKAWTSHSLLTPHTERTPMTTILSRVSLPGLWLRRLRCRHELSTLTPEQMRDTGLNPEMVRRESRKPFWEA